MLVKKGETGIVKTFIRFLVLKCLQKMGVILLGLLANEVKRKKKDSISCEKFY